MMKTGEKGVTGIKHYESINDSDLTKIGLQWKKDTSGNVTIGWGRCLFFEGKPIKSYEFAKKIYPQYETITEEEAELFLKEDLAKEEKKVNSLITRPLLQHEFDALVSYFYNIGVSNTMVALVNAKADAKEITDWFVSHYITSDGKFKQGLLYRRQTEALLYTTGQLHFYNT